MGVSASRSIEGDFDVFNCRKCGNNFDRRIPETVLGQFLVPSKAEVFRKWDD